MNVNHGIFIISFIKFFWMEYLKLGILIIIEEVNKAQFYYDLNKVWVIAKKEVINQWKKLFINSIEFCHFIEMLFLQIDLCILKWLL